MSKTKTTKKAAAPKATKSAKTPKAKKPAAKKAKGEAKPKKLSALDAAAQVLAASKEPIAGRHVGHANARRAGGWPVPARASRFVRIGDPRRA
jgi:hypothetical protein